MKRKIIFFLSILFFGLLVWMQKYFMGLTVAQTGHRYLMVIFYILAGAMLFLMLFMGGWMSFFKPGLVKLYPVAVLSLGLMYMFVFPPMSAPDEIAHFVSAYKISNYMLFQKATTQDGHVIIRSEDLYLEDVEESYLFDTAETRREGVLVIKDTKGIAKVLGSKLEEDTYRSVYGLEEAPGSKRNFVVNGVFYEKSQTVHPPVKTTPVVYLPQAIGISIGRILYLNPVELAFLGRCLNLLAFTLLGTLGIYLMPRGKIFFFLASLLPTTLELVSSLSYDAMVMGGMLLFTGYVFHLKEVKERVGWKQIGLVALMTACFFPCKIIYSPLLGLLFLIPIRKYSLKKSYSERVQLLNFAFWMLCFFIVLIAWLGTTTLVNLPALTHYSTSQPNTVAWANQESYHLSDLFHHKMKAISLFYNTFLTQGETYHQTLAGGYLGTSDPVVGVPYPVMAALTLGLLLATFSVAEKKQEDEDFIEADIFRIPNLKMRERVYLFILCALVLFLAMLTMLVAWTPVTRDYLEGVSGRYFLPVLPLFLLALQSSRFQSKTDLTGVLLYGFIYLNCFSLLKIFTTICMRL